MSTYTIYTDGAYSFQKNTGGIGFVILNDRGKIVAQFTKSYKNTTNNRMEQMAVLQALNSIKVSSDITIYSDSAYVVNTYNEGWKSKEKSNSDLWQRLDEAISKHSSVKFILVKGHCNVEYNEMADRLARGAVVKSVSKGITKFRL
jgi:ribonuclease HI